VSTGLWTWHNTIRTQFAEMEKDAGTGLDHTPFRKYESGLGRWTSPDPYPGSMSLTDPQSMNRYAYVQNDPVNFIDPTGLAKKVPCFNVDEQRWELCDDDPPDERIETRAPRWSGADELFYSRFILNSRYEGYTGGRNGFRNPIDRDTTAVNNALAACGIGAGIGQYSNVWGDQWKGPRDGMWHRGLSGQGPNQHTGARSVALANANNYRSLGRAYFGVGAAFSFYQGVQSYQQGNRAGAAKSALDIGMSYAGTFGGPKGLAVSGIYFGVDMAVGWDNVGEALAHPPGENNCRARQLMTPRLGPPR